MQGIKRYLQFVKPYRWLIAITIIIGLVKFGIPLIMPWLLKYIIDDVIQGAGSLQDKTSQLITAIELLFYFCGIKTTD